MKKERKQQAGKYFIFGVVNTLVNYGLYEALALLVFTAENQLWLATLISGVVGIFTGYYLHSRFTWKEREVGKKELGKFFVWNVGLAVAIKPALTWMLEQPKFLYKLAYDICQAIHIPFSYDFVETTGIFVLMTAVVMVINFLVYDRFVFGKKKEEKNREEIEVKSVRKSREEVEGKREA